MKLTPTFPGHIKPVRVGIYQRKDCATWGYAYWSGSQWSADWLSARKAYLNRDYVSFCQQLPWRGLAVKP